MISKIVNTDVESGNEGRGHKVTRNAPFATSDTPETKVKIIGGRLRIVENKDVKSVSDVNNGITHVKNLNARSQAVSVGRPSIEGKQHVRDDNITYSHDEHIEPPLTTVDFPENRHSITANFVLPPISRDDDDDSRHRGNPSFNRGDSSRSNSLGLDRHLHGFAILPNKAVQLNLMEEVELRQRVSEDLRGVSVRSLKDIYLDLTKFDPQLTGFADFTDLSFALLRNQINLSVSNQRLISSLFLLEHNPKKVNYEKFLQFLSSSMKLNRNRSNSLNYHDRDALKENRQSLLNRGLRSNSTNGIDNMAINSKLSNTGYNQGRLGLNKSQLLLEVGNQLKENDAKHLDFYQIWDVFRDADCTRSMALTRDQIKVLSYKCNIHMDEDILDQVIDQCYKGNDLYWWEKFLNFIGRFMIHKTGLHIPESRRPVDFSRQNPLQPKLNLAKNQTTSVRRASEDRLSVLEQKEKEIERLEKLMLVTRERLAEYKRSSTQPEPWLDRFMKLARAMYEFEDVKTGHVKAMEARWLTKEYSRCLNLDIQDVHIESAIQYCIDDHTQFVPIELLLRKLMAQV